MHNPGVNGRISSLEVKVARLQSHDRQPRGGTRRLCDEYLARPGQRGEAGRQVHFVAQGGDIAHSRLAYGPDEGITCMDADADRHPWSTLILVACRLEDRPGCPYSRLRVLVTSQQWHEKSHHLISNQAIDQGISFQKLFRNRTVEAGDQCRKALCPKGFCQPGRATNVRE